MLIENYGKQRTGVGYNQLTDQHREQDNEQQNITTNTRKQATVGTNNN